LAKGLGEKLLRLRKAIVVDEMQMEHLNGIEWIQESRDMPSMSIDIICHVKKAKAE
jgi:hypothetical protein